MVRFQTRAHSGTLIGLYMMKHMGFTARECIAWLRIVRPVYLFKTFIITKSKFTTRVNDWSELTFSNLQGSVIGPQQHYLVDQEQRMLDLSQSQQVSTSHLYFSVCASACASASASVRALCGQVEGIGAHSRHVENVCDV